MVYSVFCWPVVREKNLPVGAADDAVAGEITRDGEIRHRNGPRRA